MRIAVLGLGHMGSAIAGRLLDAGHELHVWNRTAARAEPLTARGAILEASPGAAVREVEVAITSLADDEAVLGVVVGDDGVAECLPPSGVLADMSTVSPETSRRLARAVEGRFVDAPIVGAPQAVASGQATILLGGPDELVDRLMPLFQQLSARQLRCGPAGSGTTVKVVANLLLLGQLTVLSEAVATAQANGVDDRLIAELGRTPLVAPALHNRLDDVIHGDHQGWFSARLGHKDVRLAQTLARSGGLDLAVAATVEALFDQTVAAGLGDRDISAVVEAVRARRVTEAPAARR
ncbi:MAG: 6-phosphogluconate dehydrogenase NAD-binding protein [Chloroflexi bacterium]|jgi:3-hydroxyisobutyrate dehydrogenase-like beta-hydroxyacid dehydrogenase|nr:6-phosphogluconate dehydrogenase NAD-binding protein [Chloroflexota bacterium]